MVLQMTLWPCSSNSWRIGAGRLSMSLHSCGGQEQRTNAFRLSTYRAKFPSRYEAKEFHVKNCIPVLKSWALLFLLASSMCGPSVHRKVALLEPKLSPGVHV